MLKSDFSPADQGIIDLAIAAGLKYGVAQATGGHAVLYCVSASDVRSRKAVLDDREQIIRLDLLK